jgi:hypothetical protein
VRNRVSDEIITADQYPRKREATIDTIRAAQISQTMRGIFFQGVMF